MFYHEKLDNKNWLTKFENCRNDDEREKMVMKLGADEGEAEDFVYRFYFNYENEE